MNNYILTYKPPPWTASFQILDWFSMSYNLKVNDFGSLTVDLPPIFPSNFFKKDGIIEIWRSVGAGNSYLEGNTCFIILLTREKNDEQGRKFTHILAYSAPKLLSRRIVDYPADSAYTSKTACADNMIKAIARENFGTLCTDASRSISSVFEIENDLSLAPSVTKSFAHQNVLSACQAICDLSLEEGTKLFFDVTWDFSRNKFILSTKINCPNVDRGISSGRNLTFSKAIGNLSYSSVAFNHVDEANRIIAGGQGEGSERIIQRATDTSRSVQSAIALTEDWIDAVNQTNSTSVMAEAKAQLTAKAPKIGINGHIIQTPECVYGQHYNFGDIVIASHDNLAFDVMIDSVDISVSTKDEKIEIYSRNLEDNEY